MKGIITASDALSAWKDNKIILIDATGGANPYDHYVASHLEGAQYVNLEADLSSITENPKQGGRHPLAKPIQFAKLMQKLGIHAGSHVVVYDKFSGGNAAARFWWMMRAQGHEAIQVLDGGFTAAINAGFAQEAGTPVFAKVQGLFTGKDWSLPTIDIKQVEAFTQDAESLIIDVREEARYQGLSEPIDLIAGHIPSAINIPFKLNLNSEGLFKSKEELQEIYGPYLDSKNSHKVAVHCGSGVTACHSLLAMDLAGYTIPNLYVGSWSEWSRNKL